jgi:hypothetical protein
MPLSAGRRLAILALALVAARSLVWVCWEQSHFDSDQAIYGLMAKHLAEGRAFPVFMYGQTYMLAVEAWLAAPLFALFGSSVALLKLPVLAINLAIAALLVRTLARDAGLQPLEAFAASLPFVAAPPIVSSRLAEAAGGNVEPLLYTLILWVVRARPAAFGAVAGIGILHREFTVYAVVAIWLLAWRDGVIGLRRGWRRIGTPLAVMAAVILVVNLLAARSDIMGPGTAGMLPAAPIVAGTAVQVCTTPSEIGPNLAWLVSRNLPALFGWRHEPLAAYNITSRSWSGHGWALWPLGLTGTLALVVRLRHRSDPASGAGAFRDRVPPRRFPVYLLLVGLQAALVYVVAGCSVRDPMLIRYTLLALFAGVGLVAMLFQASRSRTVSLIGLAGMFAWASASLWDSGRLIDEYVRREPPNSARQLITYLESQRVQYGRAPYWTAYAVTFLSQERITLASTGKIRVTAYQDAVARAANPVTIATDPPCTDPRAVRLQQWCIIR